MQATVSKFKVKYSEINAHALCLENTLKGFIVDTMEKTV